MSRQGGDHRLRKNLGKGGEEQECIKNGKPPHLTNFGGKRVANLAIVMTGVGLRVLGEGAFGGRTKWKAAQKSLKRKKRGGHGPVISKTTKKRGELQLETFKERQQRRQRKNVRGSKGGTPQPMLPTSSATCAHEWRTS